MLTKSVDKIAESAYAKAMVTLAEMNRGESQGLDWADDLKSGKVTLQEMIGTDSGAEEFLERVNLEAYQEVERPENSPLYTALYDVVEDSTLPKLLTVEEMGPYGIVFLEHLEGGEVKFGTLEPGQEKNVRIRTYTSGLEYTEDMLEFNELFRVTDQARQMGRAYVATLNYLALYPIYGATYVTSSADLKVARDYQEGIGYDPTAQLIAWDTSIQQTLRNALTVLPAAQYILCNSGDQFLLEDAIAGSMLPDLTPSRVKRQLRPENIIVWDGFKSKVGAKTYEYAGVTSGYCYLVAGSKLNYRLYVKHGLRITQGDGDLSRLIISQVVARARIGAYAANAGADGTVKVKITSA
jgi:hypothetical protein